jgi:hypothetical protein
MWLTVFFFVLFCFFPPSSIARGSPHHPLHHSYGESRADLASLLAGVSVPPLGAERLVDVRWRLDHVVRSRHLERIGRPVFWVRFVTEGRDGREGGVEFRCSQAQMQDLVTRLGHAVRQPARHVEGQ